MRRDFINHLDIALGIFEYLAKDVMRIRKEMGISEEKFDVELGLKPGSTAMIERMAQMPDSATLRAIVKYVDEKRGIAGKNYCNYCGSNFTG